MKRYTPTEVRKDLYNILKDVSFLERPIEVTNSKNENDSVVIISKKDWLSIKNSVIRLRFERNISKQAIMVIEENGIELYEIAQINYDGTVEYFYDNISEDTKVQIIEEAKKYPQEMNTLLNRVKHKWTIREDDEQSGESMLDLGNHLLITGEEGVIKEFQKDLLHLQELATNNAVVKILDIEIDYWQSLKILENYPESYDHYQSIENVKVLLRQFISRLEWIELYS